MMPIRYPFMKLMRGAWIALVFVLSAAPATAQQPRPADQQITPPTPLSTLEAPRLALDQIEQSIGRESVTDTALVQARASLEPLRDDLRAAVEGFEHRLGDVDARRKQLGPQPQPGVPPKIRQSRPSAHASTSVIPKSMRH